MNPKLGTTYRAIIDKPLNSHFAYHLRQILLEMGRLNPSCWFTQKCCKANLDHDE